MIESGQLRPTVIRGDWRRPLVGVVVVLAVAVFSVADRHQVLITWRTLVRARPMWCVVSGLLLMLWLANAVGLQRAALRVTGVRMRLANVAAATGIAHFLNLTTKSGGLAGLVGLRAEARRATLPDNSVVAGYIVAAMLTEWAFVVVVIGSFAVLVADGHLTVADVIALCAFVVYVASRCAVLVAATKDRERLRSLVRFPSRVLSWLRRRPLDASTNHSDETADRLFDSLRAVRARPGALGAAVGHALATEVIAIALLWSCLRAVGVSIGPLHTLVVYAVTGLFGIVGFLPGGLGFVEVSMSAVLVGFGVRSVTAASGVVLYRAFELWLPIVLGAILAHRIRFDTP